MGCDRYYHFLPTYSQKFPGAGYKCGPACCWAERHLTATAAERALSSARRLLSGTASRNCINELTVPAFGLVFWSCLLFLVVHNHSFFFTALPAAESVMISRVPAADERQPFLVDTVLFVNQLGAVFFNLGVDVVVFMFVPIAECVFAVRTSLSSWPCSS